MLEPISAERAEQVLHWIAGLGRPGGLVVTTTEAPQLRRVAGRPALHGGGIRDGNGILFISHTGNICPSGFLEVPAGHVLADHVVDVYRTAPLFNALRDPDLFAGYHIPDRYTMPISSTGEALAVRTPHDTV